MSRQQVFSELWIEAEDRLPNPDIHRHILTYNEHTELLNNPFPIVIKDIVKYMHQLWNGKIERPYSSPGTITYCALEITHWMPLYPPSASEPKKTGRRS